MLPRILLGIACLGALIARPAAGQIELRANELIVQDAGQALIDDLSVQSFSTAQVLSVREIDGVRTVDVRDDQLKLQIIDDPAAGITCRVTRRYAAADTEKLEAEQPELQMHLSAIPKQIGDSEIEILADVTTTYTAPDAKTLKEEHPEIHELYEKYAHGPITTQLRLEGRRPLRLRIAPRGKAVIEEEGAMDEEREEDRDDDDNADRSPTPDKDDGAP